MCAWVSNAEPRQNSNVTVYGRLYFWGSPISNATMTTVWHYKSTDATEMCTTGTDGIGRCMRNVGRATVGYKVVVSVTIVHAGEKYDERTWFTPQ